MDLTSHSSAPTQFLFPILKHSDILQCMSELDIELSKAELAEPQRHKDRVRKVFVQLLEICCGLTEDDFMPSPAALEQASSFEYPQVHEDFCDLKFYFSLRNCMETCGIRDFGWKDLHAPTAKRFRNQLSAFINLAKFREENLRFYAELNSDRVLLSEALAEVHEEYNVKNQRLEEAKAESHHKFQEMEEVERECEELELEIARNNKLQASLREEATQLKRQANDLKDELATAELALQEAEAECSNLRAKIVSSPDRRKAQLEGNMESLKQERQQVKMLEEQLQTTKTKILHVTQAIQDVPETTKLMDDVLETTQKMTHLKQQITDAKMEREAIHKKTDDIVTDMEESTGALRRAEEKLAHLRKQAKVKMGAAQESLDLANEQLLLVEKDHLEGMARVDAGEAEVKSMEAHIEEERKTTQHEISVMIQEYRLTEKTILADNARLMTAIGALS